MKARRNFGEILNTDTEDEEVEEEETPNSEPKNEKKS